MEAALNAARILVVEDESLIAEEVSERLRRLGFTVVGLAASGEDALVQAGVARPDLALMDIRLRGKLDGIEAAAELHERFDVPVVYLTAHSDDATLTRAKRTRPLGFLLKPVQEAELRVAVETALQRHALERRIRESEATLAATLTSIGDAVIATDEHGRVTFMNPVAEALTRWRREDAQGQPVDRVFQLILAASKAVAANPALEALRTDSIVSLTEEAWLKARDGSELPVDDCAAPIRVNGHRRGAVLVFRDVTERKRSQEALQKAEEQLRQAQKMEALGRLAGGVAHDVNNVMSVVIGYSDLLLHKMDPKSPLYGYVAQIKAAGDRAAAFTRQLLAFGRRQIVAPDVIDVNEVLTSMRPMLQSLLGEDVALTVEPGAKHATTRIDRGQLEQVVLNLAINARDAMPEGGALALVSRDADLGPEGLDRTPEVQPGRYVELAVQDTGVGMTLETQARIFEPFFTTKDLGRGTGLGLFTVYGIVKQAGGHIFVSSDVGRGTTFRVHLPLIVAEGWPGPEGPPDLPVGGSETILLVEDDDEVRAVTRAMLLHYGYTVIEAADGREAVQVLERDAREIHLLLTDAIMPHMSGRELSERARHLRPAVKVLFMSGHTEDRILRQGIQSGELAFVHKPFTAIDLTRRIRLLLDEGSGRR